MRPAGHLASAHAACPSRRAPSWATRGPRVAGWAARQAEPASSEGWLVRLPACSERANLIFSGRFFSPTFLVFEIDKIIYNR